MLTANKLIYKYEEIQDKLLSGLNKLVDPIKHTISPRGANVNFVDDRLNIKHTNDGVTIAKNISVYDHVEDFIIQLVKSAALETNNEAGDGTSTTALLAQILIKDGLRLVSDGWNPMVLKKEYEKFGVSLLKELSKEKIEIKNKKELSNIAIISSNDDKEIAKDVVKIISIVGEDGIVFIEPNKNKETELEIDSGFLIQRGMFTPELRTDSSRFSVGYKNVLVFITDKRLYYHEEAATILEVVMGNGYNSVVIVAKDFIGQAVNTFIANHTEGKVNVLLIKEPNTDKITERLEDLSVYLGGKVITDKKGKLVNKISIADFCVASNVFSDGQKTVFTSKNKYNPEAKARIIAIKKEIDKNKDDKEMKERLASLTNGMVTIRVGGDTPIEVNERIYRYEDSVNATRAAMKYGYLVGGGVSILKAFNNINCHPELRTVFKKFCEGNIRQIAENCGKHPETILQEINKSNLKNAGYNALTDKVENLLKSGVIDPFKVTEMAIRNSISVSNVIISSKYLIVNDIENYDEQKKDKRNKEENKSNKS